MKNPFCVGKNAQKLSGSNASFRSGQIRVHFASFQVFQALVPNVVFVIRYLQPHCSTTMSSYCLYTTLFPESMYSILMGLSFVGTQQLGGVLLGSMEFMRVWMMAWLVGSRCDLKGKSHTPSQWYAS